MREKAVFSVGALVLREGKSGGYSEVYWILHGLSPIRVRYQKYRGNTVLHVFLGEKILSSDVRYGFYNDILTLRLFLPTKTYRGKSIVEKLVIKATRKLVLKAISDLILEFGEVSYNIVFNYESIIKYILSRKLKPYGVIDFLVVEYINNLNKTISLLSNRVRGILESLCNEGILINEGEGYYRVHDSFISHTLKSPHYTINKVSVTLTDIMTSIIPRLNLDTLLKTIIEYTPYTTHTCVNPYTKIYITLPNGSTKPLEWRLREVKLHPIGRLGSSILNDIVIAKMVEKKVIVKKYREVKGIKWIPVTLWLGFKENFTPDPLERMARELYAIYTLKSYGMNTPTIHSVDWYNKVIVRDFIEGNPLSTLIGKMELHELNKIYYLVGGITAKIHSFGLSIGDHKPSNIVVSSDYKIFVIDLEQASTKRNPSWDIIELLSFTAVNAKYRWSIIRELYHSLVKGYLSSGGDISVIEGAFKPKYIRVFTPLVPLNILVKLKGELKR